MGDEAGAARRPRSTTRARRPDARHRPPRPVRRSEDRREPSHPDAPDGFLLVARIIRVHGTTGELACEIVTEFPQRFRQTRSLYLRAEQVPDGETPRPHTVRQARLVRRGQGQQLLLQLEGIEGREAAEVLRGYLVLVPEGEAWKLPSGRFYWHQIVGLRVVTADGRKLGTVKEILETGANDVYVVEGPSGELLLPAIKDVVKEIAPDRGEMVVELLPGME